MSHAQSDAMSKRSTDSLTLLKVVPVYPTSNSGSLSHCVPGGTVRGHLFGAEEGHLFYLHWVYGIISVLYYYTWRCSLSSTFDSHVCLSLKSAPLLTVGGHQMLQ